MATRSSITLQVKNGPFFVIYCHHDGYLFNGLGETLIKKFNTYEKVEELMSMGDASYIKENMEDSVFYARDRGEVGFGRRIYEDYEELIEDEGQEYNYLFTDAGSDDGEYRWVYDYGEVEEDLNVLKND